MILNIRKHITNTNSTKSNHSLLVKMIISYSIFLLIILILFCIIYSSAINNMRNAYNRHNETTLISDVELFETDLHIMEVFCRQLLQDDTFRKLMNTSSNTLPGFLELGSRVRNNLATDIYLETLLPIKESFCYFPLTNYIANPNHFITQPRFYEWIQQYPLEQQDIWLSYQTDSRYQNRFLYFENFTAHDIADSEQNFYMYIIDLNDLYFMEAPVTVNFIFDNDAFTELFNCINTEDNRFLMVTDAEGSTILFINEENTYTYDTILSADYDGRFATLPDEENSLTIGKYTSSNTGYTYYYSFTSFEKSTNINSLHYIFLITLFMAILSGGFLIYYFSRRNIRPIIELGQELHEAVEAQSHLQEVVEHQRPIICTTYVRQLLSGTITSEEELSYICNYLELSEAPYYNVLYVVMYNNFENSSEVLPAELDTPEDVQNVIAGALQNFLGAPLYYFSPAERTYSILLPCDSASEKDFILKINNSILRLHNYMLDTYDIWLFAGIGRNTDTLMNVWESYQQAKEAVNYTSKNYIFFPYEFIKKNSNMFYYPAEISTKLIHFISTGNTAQVLELFNLIHQENIEERSLPINLLKYLLSDIRNTLLKARFTLPSDADPDTVKIIDERFNEHPSFKLCEDIALTLCKLFATESSDSSLTATIEKYIAKNYQDPSLGLNKISDAFQISESYFSHMFKEKTGVNFSTYLENIRMREAARLIQETDISLNELYIAVGYNNANSFRRAFKKVYGVTPSNMRDTAPR